MCIPFNFSNEAVTPMLSMLTRWLLLRDHHYLWFVARSTPAGFPSRLILLRLLGKLMYFEDVPLQAEERGESLLANVTLVNLT